MERWSLGVRAPAIRLHSTAPLLQYSVIMFSPDVANQFAAQVLFAGLRARHHAARGRDNRCAHASEHARNLCRANVAAQPRLTYALQADNDALAPLILQLEFKFPGRLALNRATRDISLVLEDIGYALLHPRVRNLHFRHQPHARVSPSTPRAARRTSSRFPSSFCCAVSRLPWP